MLSTLALGAELRPLPRFTGPSPFGVLIIALKNVYSCFKGLIRPFPEVYFRFKGLLSK
ncbi:hypothetical protein BBM1605_02325 [Bifidobacterium breve MCC 1605]|nr:hypothetical protein BBM1605_02325 [Bifidobacterium breve MCC 1605]